MNKKTLTGLLSVLCVLLCALLLFCACGGNDDPAETGASEVTTEAPAAVTDPETNAPETAPETVGSTLFTYTITVVDTDDNPIEGVDVQMCAADGTCFLPVKTDANGVANFEKEDGDYYVTIAACPEGYVADSTQKYTFEGTSTEMTVTLEKAGEATEETEESSEEITEAPTEPETQDPLREDYDIAANSESVDFSAASYTGKVFQLMNYGKTILLGDYDLSQYASIIVIYGSDGGAMLGDAGSEIVLTANGAVSDGDNKPLDSAVILGSAPLTNPTAGDREAVITLDTDYNGPVYINHKMASSDGIAISAIILMKKESTAPTEPVEPVVVDLTAVSISGSWTAPMDGAGFGLAAGMPVAVLHYGSINLGEMDLSKYSKMTVAYSTPVGTLNGSDFGAEYEATGKRVLLLNAPSAVQDGTAFELLPADDAIITTAHYDMASATGEIMTVELDLTAIDYNGPLYLSFDARNANNEFGAIAYLVYVIGITFE